MKFKTGDHVIYKPSFRKDVLKGRHQQLPAGIGTIIEFNNSYLFYHIEFPDKRCKHNGPRPGFRYIVESWVYIENIMEKV